MVPVLLMSNKQFIKHVRGLWRMLRLSDPQTTLGIVLSE